MKRLSFLYNMTISTGEKLHDHRFTLRCLPDSDERQGITLSSINVTPNDYLCTSRDQWGNRLLYGACKGEHDYFAVEVRGTALTGLSDCVKEEKPFISLPFAHPTPLTRADEALSALAHDIYNPGLDALEQGVICMETVHSLMTYCPGVSDVDTTAAQAFENKRGVCQDYAHIMLAVMRELRIPCRYVVGLVTGEGESHAWTEVLCRDSWYVLDPTAKTLISDSHIKISHGRDHADCRINLGIFRGGGQQTSKVHVSVCEAERIK